MTRIDLAGLVSDLSLTRARLSEECDRVRTEANRLMCLCDDVDSTCETLSAQLEVSALALSQSALRVARAAATYRAMGLVHRHVVAGPVAPRAVRKGRRDG